MATIPEQYESQRVGVQGYRVLNLDLDGVCADYKGAIRDYLQRQGIDVPERALQTAHYNLTREDGWQFETLDDYIETQHLLQNAALVVDAKEADFAALHGQRVLFVLQQHSAFGDNQVRHLRMVVRVKRHGGNVLHADFAEVQRQGGIPVQRFVVDDADGTAQQGNHQRPDN